MILDASFCNSIKFSDVQVFDWIFLYTQTYSILVNMTVRKFFLQKGSSIHLYTRNCHSSHHYLIPFISTIFHNII